MQSEIPKEIPGYQQSEALGAAGITAETFLWVDRMAKEPKTKIKPTNIFQFIYLLFIICFAKFIPIIRNIACCVRFLLCS